MMAGFRTKEKRKIPQDHCSTSEHARKTSPNTANNDAQSLIKEAQYFCSQEMRIMGSQTYFVVCRDVSGQAMTTVHISNRQTK